MKTTKIEADKLFFTSDLHFHHNNMIKMCNRPFKDVDEMNEGLIKNWNSVVPKDGRVFLLGDVSWKTAEHTDYLINQLNGKITLIIGNHDPQSIISLFETRHDMLGVTIKEDDGKQTYVHLSHFPLLEWDRMYHGSIHLHGHCHGNLDELDKDNYKRLDVGIDSHNMKPISWHEIKEILKSRKDGQFTNRSKG